MKVVNNSLFNSGLLAKRLAGPNRLNEDRVRSIVERRLAFPKTVHSNIYYRFWTLLTRDQAALEELHTEQSLEGELRKIGSLQVYATTDKVIPLYKIHDVFANAFCYGDCIFERSPSMNVLVDKIIARTPEIVLICKKVVGVGSEILKNLIPSFYNGILNLFVLTPGQDCSDFDRLPSQNIFDLRALTDHFVDYYQAHRGFSNDQRLLQKTVRSILSRRLKQNNETYSRTSFSFQQTSARIRLFFCNELGKKNHLEREIFSIDVERFLEEEIRKIQTLDRNTTPADDLSLYELFKINMRLIEFSRCLHPNSKRIAAFLEKSLTVCCARNPFLLEKLRNLEGFCLQGFECLFGQFLNRDG